MVISSHGCIHSIYSISLAVYNKYPEVKVMRHGGGAFWIYSLSTPWTTFIQLFVWNIKGGKKCKVKVMLPQVMFGHRWEMKNKKRAQCKWGELGNGLTRKELVGKEKCSPWTKNNVKTHNVSMLHGRDKCKKSKKSQNMLTKKEETNVGSSEVNQC